MRKCPYCAKEIQGEAIRCKHCEKDVSDKKSQRTIKDYTCPKCLKEYDSSWNICLSCQEPLFLTDTTRAIVNNARKEHEKNTLHNSIVLGLIGLVVSVVVVSSIVPSFFHKKDMSSSPAAEGYGNRNGDAYTAATMYIRNSISTPSTIQFQPVTEALIKKLDDGSQSYEIFSYFDAQNEYGAMIRTKFKCVVKQQDNDNWTMLDFKTY